MAETATTVVTPNPTEQQVIQQATTGTESPKEFTYTFGDGRVIKAPSQEELTKQVGERYNQLHGHAETLKTENKQFRDSVANLVNDKQTQNGYSQEKYLEIWTKDPLAAQQYLNSYDPQLNQAVNALNNLQWQKETDAFTAANPDFQSTPQNISALSRLCDQLYPGQKVINAAQIESAHLLAQKQKLYGEATVTETKKEPPPVPPAGSGSQSTQGAPDINKMDQNQLRQYIESLESKQ